ncbi:ParB N-terminal domain-containing protein [Microbacterium sp. MMO-10]|uniref:ParB N-terminal domain-containing protein n=1 Tax=Microbacterium sp. MMO-10 TaxID=3081272 RepID=UPI00301A4F34
MLYQFMPRLSDDEYAKLEQSIREHGIQVPVLVDEVGSIIDGHHRREIATRLGIDCPVDVREGLSDAAKRTLALSLNDPGALIAAIYRAWNHRRAGTHATRIQITAGSEIPRLK